MVKRLAIIPARKGSKRLKNKNIKLFFNKPIIIYSIETTIQSEIFDTIHLSTDSKRILELGISKGLEKVPLREKKLSKDNVPLLNVLKSVYFYYQKKDILFDEIWLIMPCAPLLVVEDLIGAKNLFAKYKGKFPVMPVTKFSAPIQRAHSMDKNFFLKQVTKTIKVKSQNYKNYYHDTGAFAIFPKYIFNEKKKLKWLGYEIPRERSVDIDDINDWKIAEALFAAFNKSVIK